MTQQSNVCEDLLDEGEEQEKPRPSQDDFIEETDALKGLRQNFPFKSYFRQLLPDDLPQGPVRNEFYHPDAIQVMRKWLPLFGLWGGTV